MDFFVFFEKEKKILAKKEPFYIWFKMKRWTPNCHNFVTSIFIKNFRFFPKNLHFCLKKKWNFFDRNIFHKPKITTWDVIFFHQKSLIFFDQKGLFFDENWFKNLLFFEKIIGTFRNHHLNGIFHRSKSVFSKFAHLVRA